MLLSGVGMKVTASPWLPPAPPPPIPSIRVASSPSPIIRAVSVRRTSVAARLIRALAQSAQRRRAAQGAEFAVSDIMCVCVLGGGGAGAAEK
jgi:hypothetical protein